MDKEGNKKKWLVAGVLSLICLVQIIVQWNFGEQKSYLMCDELFTYTSSNNAEVHIYDMPLNEWLNKEWYISQGAAMDEHVFEYTIPYRNQIVDVHPPLYYILMHTMSSFVPGEISFAAGVWLNIIFMVGCTLMLYFVAKEIFGNTKIALIIAGLFGITYGACNMVLFIRMYTIVAFLTLLHVYAYLRCIKKKKLDWKSYLFLGITLVLGVLTHYYFILLAFFLVVWYFVKFWIEKRYQEECYYHITIEVCAVIALAIFPAMWRHIFSDYRGEGARKNLVELSGFGGRLKGMFGYLNSDLFSGSLWILLLIAIVLLVVYIVKTQKIPIKELGNLFPVIFMCGGYFVLVSKIAPYITDRYLMPIYPLVYLIVVGGLCWFLGELIKPQRALMVCVFLFLGLSVGGFSKSTLRYAYANFTPHLELAQEYSDTYCVYIDREYDWWEYYHVVQLLKEYKSFFCISYAAIVDDIYAGMEALAEEKEVIVYVGDSELNEEITTYIQEVVGANKMELIDEYSRWKIYRAERKR